MKKLYLQILNKIIVILLRISKYQLNKIDKNLNHIKELNIIHNRLLIDSGYYILQLLKIEFSESSNSLHYTFLNHHNINNIDLIKSIYISLFNTLSFDVFNDRKALTITFIKNDPTNNIKISLIVNRKTSLEEFIELFNNKINFNDLNFYRLIIINVYKF